MKKLHLILILLICLSLSAYSQTNNLQIENLPLINQKFETVTQFHLEENEYVYQDTFEEKQRIIVNKNNMTYKFPYGTSTTDFSNNPELVECNIVLDKSYQTFKDNKLMNISIFLDDCVNPKSTGFKWSVKVHILKEDGKKTYIVDVPAIDGEYRKLYHNLSSDIIKKLIANKKLIVKP